MNYYVILAVNPYIIHQPVQQLAVPNCIVNFTCTAIAYPPPTYSWITPMENGNFNNSIIFLEYEDVKPEHIGNYTCVASSNGMMAMSDTVYLSGMRSYAYIIQLNYKLFVITHIVICITHHFCVSVP